MTDHFSGIVETVQENMRIAWKDGWERGVLGTISQILGTDEVEKTYDGPVPEELRAWCEEIRDAVAGK